MTLFSLTPENAEHVREAMARMSHPSARGRSLRPSGPARRPSLGGRSTRQSGQGSAKLTGRQLPRRMPSGQRTPTAARHRRLCPVPVT